MMMINELNCSRFLYIVIMATSVFSLSFSYYSIFTEESTHCCHPLHASVVSLLLLSH